MERYISFKLLSSFNPVTIKSNAVTMGQLINDITSNEELNKSIQIEPEISKGFKSYMVLVDSNTGKEYDFNELSVKIPQEDVLFYVIPVTSKFGASNHIYFEIDGIRVDISIKRINEEEVKEGVKKQKPEFTAEELYNISKRAIELFRQLNRM